MDDVVNAKAAMLAFCKDAMQFIQQEAIDPQLFRGLTPFNDTARNEPFENLTTYAPAAAELNKLSQFEIQFGRERAGQVALQFVFTLLGSLEKPSFDSKLFEETWDSLLQELNTPEWTYVAICNLTNFTSEDSLLELGDGISIRSRSYIDLGKLLGWSRERIAMTLGKDWSEGSHGSHVLMIKTELSKNADNLVLANDIDAYTKLSRTLLALRLLKPGLIRHGKIFFARPAYFSFGDIGITSSGYSMWRPGAEYVLHNSEVSAVRELNETLAKIGENTDKYVRSLKLALRSFTSIYERHVYQGEDQLVDAITAIEALLRIDFELSFKSAFRVAGILAANDDERVIIFDEMRGYYDSRSKVVHGGELEPKHLEHLRDHELLVAYVRRLLIGFVRLAIRGELSKEFYKTLDGTLQHSERRNIIRSYMGLS
ncbi:MAG: hypothetical protein WKF74_17700 [Pyrinomonadaceae bacterium]